MEDAELGPAFGAFELRVALLSLLALGLPFAAALRLQLRERQRLARHLEKKAASAEAYEARAPPRAPTAAAARLDRQQPPTQPPPPPPTPADPVALATMAALQARQTRALAWIVTLVAAVVETALGLYAFAAVVVPAGGYTHAEQFADRGWCRALLVFFFTALALDLALGLAFYRSHVHPLTGWAHHIVYMLFVWWLLRTRASVALVCVMVEELPTALLGAGQVFPRLRNDLAFGATFFVTRLLYQLWYVAHLVFVSLLTAPLHPAVLPAVAAGVFALGLHVMWFLQWCRNLRKYLAARSSAAAAAQQKKLKKA